MIASPRRFFPAVFVLLGFLLVPLTARAQADYGFRGGFYTDGTDPFIGFELLHRIGRTDWMFNPNVEAAFGDNRNTVTLNADAHYDLETSGDLSLWVGGGPAIVFRSFDRPFGRGSDNRTDLGLNLLAGVGFNPRASIRPYFQVKMLLSNESEGVIAFGVRF